MNSTYENQQHYSGITLDMAHEKKGEFSNMTDGGHI